MRQRATAARNRWAGTIFSTWVVLGLFLDGWAQVVAGTQVGDAEPDLGAMRVEELGTHAGSVTSR